VTTIVADDLNLYSGSNDLSLRIWNMSSGKTEHELTGHANSVSSLQMNVNYLYSSSFDKTIKEWSKTLLQSTKTITCKFSCKL
jgi:WD40 repeat protein